MDPLKKAPKRRYLKEQPEDSPLAPGEQTEDLSRNIRSPVATYRYATEDFLQVRSDQKRIIPVEVEDNKWKKEKVNGSEA